MSVSVDNSVSSRFSGVLLVLSLKVLALLLGVRDDGGSTRLPLGGADLAVLVDELVSLDETNNLIDRSTNGGVVHRQMSDDTSVTVEKKTRNMLCVSESTVTPSLSLSLLNNVRDDEGSTKSVAIVKETLVGVGDLVVEVLHDGDVDGAEATRLGRGLGPRKGGELGVDREANNLTVHLGELSGRVRKFLNFRGAHKGPRQRVAEEHHVLALVVGQRHLAKGTIGENSFGAEIRGGLTDKRGHGC